MFGLLILLIFQQEWEGKIISHIDEQGFKNQSFARLKDRLETRVGKKATRVMLNDDLKRLAELEGGLFENVNFEVVVDPKDKDQVIVKFIVKEYPLIKTIEVFGARRIDPKEILKDLQLGRFSVLNPARLKMDRNQITTLYKKKGYYFSGVEEKITKDGEDVTLVWNISEGPLVSVAEINFTGNKKISEGTLRSQMKTQTSNIFYSQPFVEEMLLLDLSRIELHYYFEGYLDIRNKRVSIEELRFSEDKQQVYVTIHIDEPIQYKIRNITFSGNTLFKNEELQKLIYIKADRPIGERELVRSVQAIEGKYREKAYINAKVNGEWKLVTDAHLVDVMFTIEENQKVYVGMIIIQGNFKTRDDVIRRELRDLAPGDELDDKKLQRSIQRLRDRRWFEYSNDGVKLEYEDSQLKDAKDILINVKEVQTADFNIHGSYSPLFGIGLSLRLDIKNFDVGKWPNSFDEVFNGKAFQGGGQTLDATFMPSAKRTLFRFDFVEPYFVGQELSFGLGGFNLITRQEAWNEEKRGGHISFTKRYDNLAFGVGFNAVFIKLDRIRDSAPDLVKLADPETFLITINPGISYDDRNSMIFPTEGTLAKFATELSDKGFASDFYYSKFTLELQHHVPVAEGEDKLRQFISGRILLGLAKPYKSTEELPISEKYFAGGKDTIRGFRYRGMGPHDLDNPTGGEALAVMNLEYSFPLISQIYGGVFYDIGTLVEKPADITEAKFRNVTGLSLTFIIPQFQVPITASFGWIISREKFDERQFLIIDLARIF